MVNLPGFCTYPEFIPAWRLRYEVDMRFGGVSVDSDFGARSTLESSRLLMVVSGKFGRVIVSEPKLVLP